MVKRDTEPGVVVRRTRVPAGQCIQHAQRATRAGRGGDGCFALTSTQRGDAVAVAHGGPRGNRSRARGLHRLEAHTRAEVQRRRCVGDDQAQAFALGLEQFGVRFKSVQAARAGAIAAWAAVRDGDRIAALRGSQREAPIAPAAGPRGALRVLDALTRWYARPPDDDAGLGVALDHAQRLLRPGSRLVVLADPGSVAALPAQRWPALAHHHEVIVLLLTDPLELAPPKASLPFLGSDAGRGDAHRIDVDLSVAAQRQAWRAEFGRPLEAALAQLPARGVRVQALSTQAESASWLPLLGRNRPLVA